MDIEKVKKVRHDWRWNTPETGQRQCRRCHLTLPIAHVRVPPCPFEPNPDIPLARIWSEDGATGIATGANETKPDESRLLTDNVICNLLDEALEHHQSRATAGRNIAKAQRDLTASLYNKEKSR